MSDKTIDAAAWSTLYASRMTMGQINESIKIIVPAEKIEEDWKETFKITVIEDQSVYDFCDSVRQTKKRRI